MEGKAKADKKEKGKKRQSVSGEQESKEAKKKVASSSPDLHWLPSSRCAEYIHVLTAPLGDGSGYRSL